MKAMFPLLACVLLSGNALGQQFPSEPDKFPSRSLVEEFGKPYGAAPGLTPRPLVAVALALIKDFEGWRPTAYNDAVGYCTIGYGHLIALKRCEATDLHEFPGALSEARGQPFSKVTRAGARLAVQSLVSVYLNEEQFGALVSFVFNVGSANFAGSSMRRLLNEGQQDLAAREFGRWVLAGESIQRPHRQKSVRGSSISTTAPARSERKI